MKILFDIIQYVGGAILASAPIPQLYRIFKRKSTQDFSIRSYLMTFIGLLCLEIYAIHMVIESGIGHALLITNSMSCCLCFMLVCAILYYRKRGNCIEEK